MSQDTIMLLAPIVVVALLLVGMLLLSNITVHIRDFKTWLIAARDFSVKTAADIQSRKKTSLRKQIEIMGGKRRSNFFIENFSEARSILEHTGQGNKVRRTKILSGVLGASGALVPIMMGNVFLAPTLGVGLALLPFWYIRLTESVLRKHLNSELEVALSTTTSSYVRNDNIILAVEENLKYFNPPVKQVFTIFVNENKLINSNVVYGVQKMKMGLDSPVFHEWCDALIQCQSDRTLKMTLFPIVNRFSDMKAVQEELDTILQEPVRDFIIVSLIVLLSIPMMYVINKTWYFTLVGTTIGKIILSVVSLCFFYGLNRAIMLTKPIEYRR